MYFQSKEFQGTDVLLPFPSLIPHFPGMVKDITHERALHNECKILFQASKVRRNTFLIETRSFKEKLLFVIIDTIFRKFVFVFNSDNKFCVGGGNCILNIKQSERE